MLENKVVASDKYINSPDIPYASDESIINSNVSKEQQLENIKKRKEIIKKEKEFSSEIVQILEMSKTKRDYDRLDEIFEYCGMERVEDDFFELPKIVKKVIRMEFWGTVDKPNQDYLSDFYKNSRDSEDKQTYNKDDYDLSLSPSWQLFAQFDNFKNIEDDVIKGLQKAGVDPKEIHNMAVEDYMDVMYNNFPMAESGNASHVFQGARNQFIKDFINKFEKPFYKIMKEVGIDERYVKALVANMKKNGTCDGFEVLDDNGERIQGVKLSVHHKTAVNTVKGKMFIGGANLFSNQCLCIDNPYHAKIFNLIDEMNKGTGKHTYLRFKNTNVAFMGGLSSLQQISFEYCNIEREKHILNNISDYDYSYISNEERANEKKKNFKDEIRKNKIFIDFIRKNKNYKHKANPDNDISDSEMIEILKSFNKRHHQIIDKYPEAYELFPIKRISKEKKQPNITNSITQRLINLKKIMRD